MAEDTKAVAVKTGGNEMEYTPFGAEDPIKLSVQIIQKFIAVPTKSGATCSDADAIKFMMMCRSRRLNPFEGDAFLIGFDGHDGPKFTLITAHQAFLKRAEVHPEYDGMESGVLVRNKDGQLQELQGDFSDEGQAVVGGWARVHFKNRKHPMYKKVKLSTFQQGYGRWKIDPAGMIVKCAEADALRSSFPTMMGGMYLREEVELLPSATSIEVPRAEASPGPKTAPFRRNPNPAITEGRMEDQPKGVAEQRAEARPDGKPSNVIDIPATTQEAKQPDPQPAAASEPASTAAAPKPQQPIAESAPAQTAPTPEQPKTTPSSSKTHFVLPPSKLPADFLPTLDASDAAGTRNSLTQILSVEGISPEELLAWTESRNLSKKGQTLADLAISKIIGLVKQREIWRAAILEGRQ